MGCKVVIDPYNVEAKCCEVTDEPVRGDGPLVDGVFEIENHEEVPVSGSVVPHLYLMFDDGTVDAGEVEHQRVHWKHEAGQEEAYNFEFDAEEALGEELWERVRHSEAGQVVMDVRADLDDLTAEEDEIPED